MTVATFIAFEGAGRGACARKSRAGLLALIMCLASTTAQALAPALPECYPYQEDVDAGWPENLGRGMVSRSESFRQPDGSWRDWMVVTECASGQSIAVAIADYEQGEAVNALVRSAIQSPEVITLSDLAGRLDRALGEAFIDQSQPADVETCPCQHFYPDLRGSKTPFQD